MLPDHTLEDLQALRLLRVFHEIKDPETRRLLIAAAEAAADGAVLTVDVGLDPAPH